MSGCGLSQEQIQKAIEFHGHWCPGLGIGLRAAELALREIGSARDEEIVAVVETDMCGVDAIQYLTGCTFGKGNLIHLDLGKNAFSFYRRADGKSLRLVFNPEKLGGPNPDMAELHRKMSAGGLAPEEEARLKTLREEWSRKIMEADLNDLFDLKPAGPCPRKARIMESLACDCCGERTMESRTRRFLGQTLCEPCFEKREKRL